MEMPAAERVRLAFQHREADRVPIYGEARNIPFIEKMSGRALRGTREEMEIVTAEAYARAGIDLTRRLLTPRWGVVKEKFYDIQWNGYLNWKIGGEEVFTLEEAVEHLKVNWCSENGFDPAGSASNTINEVNRIQAVLGDRICFMPNLSISCLDNLYNSLGVENFCVIMYEYADLLDEAIENHTNRMGKVVDVILDIYKGPIIHCCDDLGIKGSTMVSPDWMRAHLFPRVKKVVRKIKADGRYYSFHSDGEITAIIPDLIDMGVDALNPIEKTAGMDLRWVKEHYGDQLVVIGNADANIVQMGSEEDVRREVRRCLDDAADGGGYFLAGGMTQITPVENLVAYFDEAKSYRGYSG